MQGIELLTLLNHGMVTIMYKGEESDKYQEYVKNLLTDAFNALENMELRENPRKYNISQEAKDYRTQKLREWHKANNVISDGILPCSPLELSKHGVSLTLAHKYQNKQGMRKDSYAKVQKAIQCYNKSKEYQNSDSIQKSSKPRSLHVVNGVLK